MGGTISSVLQEKGFVPSHSSSDLVAFLPEIQDIYDIETREVMSTDSSNIQPNDWVELADVIFQEISRDDIHGVVVTHGTDTLAYSASAVAIMVQRHGKPVVFTGSQIPFMVPGSDGRKNLIDAIRVAADADLAENVIVFNNKIFRSVRTLKLREYDLNAFESVDPTVIGDLALEIHWNDPTARRRSNIKPVFNSKMNTNVALVRLFPGMKPELLDQVVKCGYKGIILDAFGSGNVPIKENSLLPKIKEITAQNIPIVITSQCVFGTTELLYETGKLAHEAGAIQGMDYVAEVAMIKLMWVLGQKPESMEKITELFQRNYVGEVNPAIVDFYN